MKTQKFKQLVQIGVAAGLAVLAASAYAQFHDSSIGTNALRGVPTVPQKYLPAQPTPIVNTYTTQQITQNVTQQVTQVVQPSTYIASGAGSGWNAADAYADCGGGTMLSGGGSCTNGIGLVSVSASQPNGNGWYIACGAGFQNAPVYATAYAVCSAP